MARHHAVYRYQYDALDQLVGYTRPECARVSRFYQLGKLVTEVEGALGRSVFKSLETPLAECRGGGGNTGVVLLATDLQRSILQINTECTVQNFAYSPYGDCAENSGLLSMLAFSGERPDLKTGHYLLGNGYRAFNPVLMRFNSPDSWSPFGQGGMNAYAYCQGQPVYQADPSGHSVVSWLLDNVVRSIYKWAPNLIGAKPHRIENIQKLAPGVFTYDQVGKGGRKLVIDGHGEVFLGKHYVATDNDILSASDLLKKTLSDGRDLKRYSSAELRVCYSADSRGSLPLAKKFANKSGLVTKGYSGTVDAAAIENHFNHLSVGETHQGHFSLAVRKTTGLLGFLEPGFSYRPVMFSPNEQIRK